MHQITRTGTDKSMGANLRRMKAELILPAPQKMFQKWILENSTATIMLTDEMATIIIQENVPQALWSLQIQRHSPK